MKLQNKQESANRQEGPCGAARGKPLHFILSRGLSSPYTVPGAWSAPFLAPQATCVALVPGAFPDPPWPGQPPLLCSPAAGTQLG